MGILRVLLAAIPVNFIPASMAVSGGTEKEVLALLDKGIAYIKVHGAEEA